MGTYIIASRDYTDEGADLPADTPDPLLLDIIGAPVWQAYSTRRLRLAYTGPALRVRRSTDNIEQDIPFAANNVIDTAALLAFTAAGDAMVTRWFDQSGNGHDLVQDGTTRQPSAVIAGVQDRIGPALRQGIRFSASPRHLRNSFPSMVAVKDTTGYTLSQVHTVPNGAGNGVAYGESEGSASSTSRWCPIYFNSSNPSVQAQVMTNDAAVSQSGSPGSEIVANDGRAQVTTIIDQPGAGLGQYRDGVAAGVSASWNPTGVYTHHTVAMPGYASSAVAVTSYLACTIGENILLHAPLSMGQLAELSASQRAYFGTP